MAFAACAPAEHKPETAAVELQIPQLSLKWIEPMAFQGNAGAGPIKIDISAGIATITLDRPHKMNAISHAMWDELADLVARIGKDPEARVIVLSGAGGNFSAGADIGEFDEVR
ncbi:MAG TPA: enoyl-CoA hydratase/isomerase family protein, partial [Rhizobiaceae bacterium]|nr:enoyl-CoA hydratase/isomerase family protein [Rhizobiaceae bacterium]